MSQTGNGTIDMYTERITLAQDSPGVVTLSSIYTSGVEVTQSTPSDLNIQIGSIGSGAGKDGIDSATNMLEAIGIEHHEIHEGNHFFICNATTLANGASIDHALVTPDTAKWTHMTFQISGQLETSITVYEDSDFDADGAAVTAYNNDRNSANTTDLTITTDPTVNSVGTQIYKQQRGAKKAEGFIVREREIILKQNAEYIFRITNETTSDDTISYCGEWYELTNKN